MSVLYIEHGGLDYFVANRKVGSPISDCGIEYMWYESSPVLSDDKGPVSAFLSPDWDAGDYSFRVVCDECGSVDWRPGKSEGFKFEYESLEELDRIYHWVGEARMAGPEDEREHLCSVCHRDALTRR